MKLLFYITHFFPKPTGATHATVRLARALKEKGADVSCVVDRRGPEFATGGSHDGLPVQSFTLGRPGKLRKILGLVAFTRYILGKGRSFDVFHVHGGDYVTLFLCWWVKTLTGHKVVLKITSDGWDTPESAVASKYGRLVGMFYRRLDGVVAMTTGQEQKCRVWGFRNRLATIPNCVDCQKFTPADDGEKTRRRRDLGIARDVPVLSYAGWLGEGKGTDVLFEVWRQLMERFPAVHLLLCGDYLGMAESRDRIRTFLEQHELPSALADCTQLITANPPADIEGCLQASDVFLFPSRREGFGTVQVEAMACGLPCVVNDLSGVTADIFPDESVGYRVQDNDVTAYVETCSRLLGDNALRESVGQAARRRAVATYSPDIVASSYLAFYEGLIGASC